MPTAKLSFHHADPILGDWKGTDGHQEMGQLSYCFYSFLASISMGHSFLSKASVVRSRSLVLNVMNIKKT